MIDHLKLTKELKDQEIYEIHCKIELIKGASATPRASSNKAKTEKVLTASEKYQAFLRLIPEAYSKGTRCGEACESLRSVEVS
jgi:hypothetical protein